MQTQTTEKEIRWGMDISDSTEVVDADFARQMERLLRQVLPDWADEVTANDSHKVVAELTGKDVIMIRDFLANGWTRFM